MSIPLLVSCFVLLCAVGGGLAAAQPAQPEGAANDESPLLVGGTGAVYLLAQPGELTIEVYKRDRNVRGRTTDLRAILAGPDRRVIHDVTIPHAGGERGSGWGPLQSERLTTQVERAGVYALNITVAQDRYGEESMWGFATNCPHYLVETSRGHRDRRHEEPIVLRSADRPGDVAFLPRAGEFSVELSGLHEDVGEVPLYDGAGNLVHALQADEERNASHTVPAGERGDVPWRLHFPRAQATINMDGLTRWERGDPYPDMAVWTPDPASWFPLLEHRWLLTPYQRNLYGDPRTRGSMEFQVHNNSAQDKTVALEVEFPARAWPVDLSADAVEVPARSAASVTVEYTVPGEGESRVCHVRATPTDADGYTTYSTLTVNAGVAPAHRPLDMPITLRPYEHENVQFGYLPDYPVDNQFYFDMNNQPHVRTGAGIYKQRNGEWVHVRLAEAVTARVPDFEGTGFSMASTKITFCSSNHMYLLARSGPHGLLLHSADEGETFTAYVIPGREDEPRGFEIEHFTGHNQHDGPPPVVRVTRMPDPLDPDRRLFWRRVFELELFVPRMVEGRIEMGEPLLLSEQCIGFSQHSGITATLLSRGSRVHVIWGEATDPAEEVPGVPAYVVTYDREAEGLLGEPALIGYGAPPNDVHNTPSITMDSQGYLHAMGGTHGRPFPYARSLAPNDAHSGWTEDVPVAEGESQTYIGLVCDRDDNLHLVYRLWRRGVEPFPTSHYSTLAYQRKRPGQDWEDPQVLILPPFSEYSIHYHRLTIDRLGRPCLSYEYWSTYWAYRNDQRGPGVSASGRPGRGWGRAVIMSPDGGDTWRFW